MKLNSIYNLYLKLLYLSLKTTRIIKWTTHNYKLEDNLQNFNLRFESVFLRIVLMIVWCYYWKGLLLFTLLFTGSKKGIQNKVNKNNLFLNKNTIRIEWISRYRKPTEMCIYFYKNVYLHFVCVVLELYLKNLTAFSIQFARNLETSKRLWDIQIK